MWWCWLLGCRVGVGLNVAGSVLELGDRAQDLEEHPPDRGGGVDALIERRSGAAQTLPPRSHNPTIAGWQSAQTSGWARSASVKKVGIVVKNQFSVGVECLCVRDVERLQPLGVGCGEASDRMRVLVDARDAATLRGWVSDPARPALRRRALIVLLSADGHSPAAIAARMRCSKQTVIVWCDRYIARGLDGLRDAPRSGRPATVNPAAVVLGTLRRPDPPRTRWSTRSLGTELGISNVAVGNVWRDWGIRPEPGGWVSLRTEPVLDAAVLAVLGLHIDPPVHVFAVVVTDHSNVPTAVAADPPAAPRRGLGTLLDDVLTSAGAGSDGQTAVQRFLAMLDHDPVRQAASAAPTPAGPTTPVRTALVAAGDTDSVRELTHDRNAVVLHTVTAVATWAHLLRVGCLLAGAEQDGAASVNALRAALSDHHPGRHGRPFTWTRPRP